MQPSWRWDSQASQTHRFARDGRILSAFRVSSRFCRIKFPHQTPQKPFRRDRISPPTRRRTQSKCPVPDPGKSYGADRRDHLAQFPARWVGRQPPRPARKSCSCCCSGSGRAWESPRLRPIRHPSQSQRHLVLRKPRPSICRFPPAVRDQPAQCAGPIAESVRPDALQRRGATNLRFPGPLSKYERNWANLVRCFPPSRQHSSPRSIGSILEGFSRFGGVKDELVTVQPHVDRPVIVQLQRECGATPCDMDVSRLNHNTEFVGLLNDVGPQHLGRFPVGYGVLYFLPDIIVELERSEVGGDILCSCEKNGHQDQQNEDLSAA